MAMEMMNKMHQHEWKEKKSRWSKEEELCEETHRNRAMKERRDGDERVEKEETEEKKKVKQKMKKKKMSMS